jgi:hypothetical protein
MRDGQRAGLAMLQVQPSWLGVVQTAGVRRLTFSSAGAQTAGPVLEAGSIQLRLEATQDDLAYYEYSLDDGRTFTHLGNSAKLRFSWWKGARPALFTFTTGDDPGFVDFDWAHVESPAAN